VRVLAVSPHLDDAAFSIGGTLAALSVAGHQVSVVTCFTRSVVDPTGFALACQTDKDLAADVDYLAVRRAEDRAAMVVLGATPLHLDLPEAPHRGYAAAPELFAGVRPDDDVWRPLATQLAGLSADLWLAPQGLGGHVDHLQVLRAVASLGHPVAWWRDSPYILRDPAAQPGPDLPLDLAAVELAQDRERRADACACYTTQLRFQFGGVAAMRAALADQPEPLLADARALALLARLLPTRLLMTPLLMTPLLMTPREDQDGPA
jgi:LmbE family N-acetylglucosaminyl deacetylase